MSRKPISMRKIKEVLRLKWECSLGDRQIAEICKIGRTTVQEYLSQVRVSQLTWEQITQLSDDALEKKFFPGNPNSIVSRPIPDWNEVHVERKKPGVTLQLLWVCTNNNLNY